jgi:hypothetical protein
VTGVQTCALPIYHPQLTDIVDSRAVVHDMALDGRVHRAILGLD